MKIIVGIKHVPDTETKIQVAGDGGFDASAVSKWIISPYDEFALEQALQYREANGGEVVAVCGGPGNAQATVRQALAMGADRGVHVEDERFDRCDGLARAKALAAVVRAEDAQLVLLGKYGVGTDEAQTGPMLAEVLGWPHASALTKLELSESGFSGERPVEGAVEVVEGSLPAVLTCDKGLNEPRYPSLKGIMQAKKKKIDNKKAADLGLADEDLAAAMVVWDSMELPPPRDGGQMIDGTPQEAAQELLRLLHEKEKVI